jgi:hypothetical protein
MYYSLFIIIIIRRLETESIYQTLIDNSEYHKSRIQ